MTSLLKNDVHIISFEKKISSSSLGDKIHKEFSLKLQSKIIDRPFLYLDKGVFSSTLKGVFSSTFTSPKQFDRLISRGLLKIKNIIKYV